MEAFFHDLPIWLNFVLFVVGVVIIDRGSRTLVLSSVSISEKTGIPTSQIHGVVTFYAQFTTEPQGRRKIYCCRGTACHVRGGANVINSVREVLGIDEGETTADLAFSFETVACLGTCAIAPVMVVDSTYHGKTTATGAEKMLKKLIREEAS